MANELKKLTIAENGQYKNINPKKDPNFKDGDYFFATKVYAEGMEVNGKYGISYSIKLNYEDEEVSTFIKPYEHEEFKECGGVDDKIKVTLNYRETKDGKIYKALTFELIDED